jgi:hypothetical protein
MKGASADDRVNTSSTIMPSGSSQSFFMDA